MAALAKLGLENRVEVVDAELVALDREEKNVYLSDGTMLPYDALILTCNLHDQTLARLGQHYDPAAHAVRAGRELLEEIKAGRVDYAAGALIYGGTLSASLAAQQLIKAGMDPAMVTMLRPAAGLYQSAVLAHHAMTEIFGRNNYGVLPKEEPPSRLLAVARGDGGGAGVRVQLELATGDVTEASAGLLVLADVPDVDRVTFQALNDASIVYDGRIVVDALFRTNDPNIYAAGLVAKFSRRYAAEAPGGLSMEGYSQRELGFRLADVLSHRFGGRALSDAAFPVLVEPRVMSGMLPGGMQFIHAATPAEHLRSDGVFDALPGGHRLETRVEGLCRLDVDEHGVIAAALYCGKRRLDKSKLTQLVGLPVSYLGGLVEKFHAHKVYNPAAAARSPAALVSLCFLPCCAPRRITDAGDPVFARLLRPPSPTSFPPLPLPLPQVDDLLLFLGQPWIAALYHDKFPELVRQVARQLQERLVSESGALASAEAAADVMGAKAKRLVQDCILDFVRLHAAELPSYNLPI